MSFHAASVTLEWAATASSATGASTGCIRNASLTKDPDYRCTRCRELHAHWIADHRGKSKSALISWRFVCVEVFRPSQPYGVMSDVVIIPNHTLTGQA